MLNYQNMIRLVAILSLFKFTIKNFQMLRSKLFLKVQSHPSKDATIKSHKLLIQGGYLEQHISGIYNYLPVGQRILQKLENLIDKEMQNVLNAEKIKLPILNNAELWKESKRYENFGEELFKVRDRNGFNLILGPTHEEVITKLVSSFGGFSEKNLPLGLYQITSKFRDEIRPKFGLIRAREFLMKDLYSFHTSESNVYDYYEKVCSSYQSIFDKLELSDSIVKVGADSGSMKGKFSHEFHVKSFVGEDKLFICKNCGNAANSEIHGYTKSKFLCEPDKCIVHSDPDRIEECYGIELGHTYYLGNFYSKLFNAKVRESKTGVLSPMYMGCYGLGLSRIVAAIQERSDLVEKYKDNKYASQILFWPRVIAPYRVMIISNNYSDSYLNELRISFHGHEVSSDIIIDDREKTSTQTKFLEARLLGIKWILVRQAEKTFAYDVYNDTHFSLAHDLSLSQLALKLAKDVDLGEDI